MLKEYLKDILILCAIVALMLGVSHFRLRGAIRISAGIILICAILLPLVDIIKDFEQEFDSDIYFKDFDAELSDNAIEGAFEDGVARYLADEYRVDTALISVNADGFDMGKMRAERIYVTLRGEAVRLDFKRIENEVAKEFTDGGECEVTLEIG